MREIILDTETTGLSPLEGHRLVEIGAVELVNKLPTGKTWHRYLHPERDMPKDAEAIHGLSAEFLRDKPLFRSVMDEFLEFIGKDRLVIHNASFDMGFINAELGYCGGLAIPADQVVDTLMLARKTHPNGPNSLDALCKRYNIDNTKRIKHGALLDAELLADVYLELTGGRQTALSLAMVKQTVTITTPEQTIQRQRPEPLPERLTPAEIIAHDYAISELGLTALWNA